MSEHAAKSVLRQNRKRKADGEKASGTDNARKPGEVKVRTSRTTVLGLNDDCWRVVMDYLNVRDQLRLASSNVCIEEMFKRYASHRYRHIDESLTNYITNEELRQLLQIVGDHVVSYESELNPGSNGDQRMWLLESHCANLRHLKMTFRRTRGGWNYLNSLKYLESLHAHLYFGSVTRWCMPFVHNLKQFTCLRKLKLEAFSYSGRGLDVLDQLESLEVGAYPGFDAESLADCCQTMKKLRYLNFGKLIPKISKNNFEILVTNCQQLERLAFGVELLDSTVPYELVCQLPMLQHLQVWHGGSLRESFIEGLINKQGSPLESLILEGPRLRKAQVQHLCNISTLTELDISCDTLPFADLLKLKNLVYFHISTPMTKDQLLHLLDALPRLKVLNLQFCPGLYASFLNSVRNWVNEQRKQRGRIKIYFGFGAKHVISYANLFVKIIEGRLGPILINKELKIQ